MVKKILIGLKVLQIKEERKPSGNIYERSRVNPFNPLSYLILFITIIFAIVCYGVIGFVREIGTDNPFKYR